jgi:hypothetical protein
MQRTEQQSCFYGPQIAASTEILNKFAYVEENPIRWVVLFAQMQSGKTGTYLLTACEMLRNKAVDNVVVFCGHSDNLLKNQTKEKINNLSNCDSKNDPIDQTLNPYIGYLKEHINREWDEYELNGRCPQPGKIKLYFGSSELKKFVKPSGRVLYIWDESHNSQSLNNTPSEFLIKIGVSPNGNYETLAKGGNYFISVSATPFSELTANYQLNQGKGVVVLGVTERYNSVEKMINNGLIYLYDNKFLSDELREALEEASSRFPTPSYAIIRASKKIEKDILPEIPDSWMVVNFDSAEDKSENSVGKTTWDRMQKQKIAPEQNTVIIIRERCRMGEEVDKTHISLMFETSKNPQTDTLLQSFIGRACGYGEHHVSVWISEGSKTKMELDTYIESTKTNPQPVVPTRARNIMSTNKRKNMLSPIKPIEIQLQREFLISEKEDFLSSVKNALTDLNEEWTFQQRKFADYTCKLITEHCEKYEETNFIIDKRGNRIDRIEIHDFPTNVNPSSTINDDWISLVHKLYINKYDTPPDPDELWSTTRTQINEDRSKTLYEGYKVHLFYFKDENCQVTLGDNDELNLSNKSNTVFIYGVSTISHEATEEDPTKKPIHFPMTNGNEVFSHSLEEIKQNRNTKKEKENKKNLKPGNILYKKRT